MTNLEKDFCHAVAKSLVEHPERWEHRREVNNSEWEQNRFEDGSIIVTFEVLALKVQRVNEKEASTISSIRDVGIYDLEDFNKIIWQSDDDVLIGAIETFLDVERSIKEREEEFDAELKRLEREIFMDHWMEMNGGVR